MANSPHATLPGNTAIHSAAKYSRLRDLTPTVLTAALLTLKNDSGYPPLHSAAAGGFLDQVPAFVSVLDCDMALLRTVLGTTLAHEAAESGTLDRLPVAMLNSERLLERNLSGEPVLHVAAHEGHLDQIPVNLLDSVSLASRNYEGATPLQNAALRGHTGQLPPSLRPKPPIGFRRLLIKLGFTRSPF